MKIAKVPKLKMKAVHSTQREGSFSTVGSSFKTTSFGARTFMFFFRNLLVLFRQYGARQ